MFNEHLNPRPYRTAQHIKFHIQNVNDVAGVALCGGIYSVDLFNVFSAPFVLGFYKINQCAFCISEHHRQQNRISDNA